MEDKLLLINKYNSYKKMKLTWNIEGMLWLVEHDAVAEDIVDSDDVETLLKIMTAGQENRDVQVVKAYVGDYLRKYSELDTLRIFVITDLCENHKFISFEEQDDEPLNPLLKNKKNEDNITHSEKITIAKNNLHYYIRVYLDCQYKIEQIMKMDLRYFDILNDYILRKKEDSINDYMLLAHRCGLLSGIGFASLKDYPDKPENIRLRPLSKEEQIEKLESETEQFFNTFGSDLE